MKTKKYLKIYEKLMKRPFLRMEGMGLCSQLNTEQALLLELFKPLTKEEYSIMFHKSYSKLYRGNPNAFFWAADGETDGRSKTFEFTPLRQTILLFLAAINDEL